MMSQQICELLLQTPLKSDKIKNRPKRQFCQSQTVEVQSDLLRQKLQQILNCLKEEKQSFQIQQKNTQSQLIENIHIQKDQIIEQLLKNIYNLKKQNEQLKFQYRKKFKVIKNLEDKYEKLILSKNKKITDMNSVVKYLEGKIKYVEQKIDVLQGANKGEIPRRSYLVHSKSPQNDRCQNKISVIVSKAKNNKYGRQRFASRNSLQDLTLPLKSSYVSLSKISSSRTIARFKNRQNGLQNQKQSIFFSSFMASTQQNLNEKYFDSQTVYQQASRIKPICQENSISTNQYLTLQDFDNAEQSQTSNLGNYMRRSQQIKASHVQKHQNRYKDNH